MKPSPTFSILAMSALLSACGSDSDTTSAESKLDDSQSTYIALDAIATPAYVDLGSGTIGTKDDNWQFSYKKYVGFTVNGGISGEGNVSACIAHTPDGLYDESDTPVQAAFEALTRENTLADFAAVSISSCEEADYITDGIKTYIELSDWLEADYTQGAPIYSASTETSNDWIVKSASADGNGIYNYGRVKVNEVFYQAGTKRAITFSVEQWNENSLTFENSEVSPEINFTTERQYWDMESNSVVTSADDWELSIEYANQSWNLQVNASVSGSGTAGIGHVLDKDETEETETAFDVTNPKASGDDIYKYYTDSADTALAGPGNYGAFQYGVAGGHNMWPTFTTYLFKDGDRYFKAQVVSNYGEDGTLASGNLYVRYAEVTE